MHIFSSFFNNLIESVLHLTGDWLIALVLITLLIRVVLFPLTVSQQKSVMLSQNLGKIKEYLAERHKNRTDLVNENLAKIMVRYRINPLASIIPLLIQMPVLFSLYFSLMNLSTAVGTTLVPWVLSISKPDHLHILPVLAGLSQGLTGLFSENRNLVALLLPVGLGLVFLWKAPAALSIYWGTSGLCSLLEKKIMARPAFQKRFLKVASVEEMVRNLP